MNPAQLRAFIAQVDSTAGPDGCWPWRGALTEGYGHFGKRSTRAHRAAYELMQGPIGDGLTVDHQCHNRDLTCPGGTACLHRRCVNPLHLEAVTQRENLLRSHVAMPARNAAKTHCPQGHAYSPVNTYIKTTRAGRQARECRTCARDRTRSRTAQRNEVSA